MANGLVKDVLRQADIRKRPLEIRKAETEQEEAVIEVRIKQGQGEANRRVVGQLTGQVVTEVLFVPVPDCSRVRNQLLTDAS